MTDVLDDIHTLAAELTQPRHHTEPRTAWDKHRNKIVVGHHHTTQPSLITQLRHAALPARPDNDGGRRRVPDSKPPAAIAAVDLLHTITTTTAHLLTTLNVPPTRWAPTPADRADPHRLIQTLAHHATNHPDQHTHIRRTLRRWVRDAEIITGWRNPSQKINIPCPNCGAVGTLHAHADTTTATCHHCRTIWGPDQIGLLAAIVENVRNTEKVPESADSVA